jgi:hypothetical protein
MDVVCFWLSFYSQRYLYCSLQNEGGYIDFRSLPVRVSRRRRRSSSLSHLTNSSGTPSSIDSTLQPSTLQGHYDDEALYNRAYILDNNSTVGQSDADEDHSRYSVEVPSSSSLTKMGIDGTSHHPNNPLHQNQSVLYGTIPKEQASKSHSTVGFHPDLSPLLLLNDNERIYDPSFLNHFER